MHARGLAPFLGTILCLAAAPAGATDANGDGRIDQLDVDAIIAEALGREPAAGEPDCTADERVTVADAVCVTLLLDCDLDRSPPFVACPDPVVVDLTAEDSCVYRLELPAASDGCDASPLVFAEPPYVHGVGVHDVTVVAIDSSGNVDTCDTTVEITGCPDGLEPPLLLPDEKRLVAGDTAFFDVVLLDPEPDLPALCFSVDGVSGGSEDLGFLDQSTSDPLVAVYEAPFVSVPTMVALEVARCSEPERKGSALVEIQPLTGTYEILPAGAEIGLGTQRRFQAGVAYPGGSFVPLTRAFWSVNGIAGGRADVGTIDATGLYTAPKLMPGPAPFALSVSYSLTDGGLTEASESFRLTELDLAPDSFVSTMEGPAGAVTATLTDSDGAVRMLPRTELRYQAGNPQVARVDAASNVVIGPHLGRDAIQGVHVASGAVDHVVAESRSGIELTLDAQRITRDHARYGRGAGGHLEEIEFTAPGAAFDVIPRVRILRGQQAGSVLSGLGDGNVSFFGDGVDVLDLGPGDRFPQGFQRVGLVHRELGTTWVGRSPGRGTITVTYDDGLAQGSASLDLIFSRIEISAEAMGDKSLLPDEAFITEYVQIDIEASNPNGAFFGEIPLELTLGDTVDGGEEFSAAFFLNIHTGNAQRPFIPNSFEDTDRLNVTLNATDHPLGFVNEPGIARLLIAPRRAGLHRFWLRVKNDPDIEPIELPVQVRLPELALRHADEESIPSDSVVVRHSWVDVFHRGDGVPVSPFDLYQEPAPNTFSRFAHNDVPFWTISDETTWTVPATNSDGHLAQNWNEATTYRVKLGLTDHPWIETQELLLQVVEPDTFTGVPSDIVGLDDTGTPGPSNALGGFQILSVPTDPWIPGETFKLRVQCLRADGTPGPVGRTVELRQFNSSGELVGGPFYSHDLVGVNVTFVSFAGHYVSGTAWPVDDTGIIEVDLVSPPPDTPFLGDDLILRITPRSYTGLASDAFTGTSLPIHQRDRLSNGTILEDATPYGRAEYPDPRHAAYLDQCLFVSGYGVIASPRQWARPSQRLVDRVDAMLHPADWKQTRVTLLGNAGFPAAIASGPPSFSENGDGLSIVSSSVTAANRLELVLEIDPAAATGDRTVQFSFPDGSTWDVDIEVVAIELDFPGDHGDVNLPLNGNHHQAHPVGSQVFFALNTDFSVVHHSIELELIPSLMPGDEFRGATTDQPLVGFRREPSSTTGEPTVSQLHHRLFQRNNFAFLVFGNVTDERKLDRTSRLLGGTGEPDGLADFNSAQAGAELLVARSKGNVLDVLPFAAYNFVAEVQEDLVDQQLGFDQVAGDIDGAYGSYSPPISSTTLEQFDDGVAQLGVSVGVDHEARWPDLDQEREALGPIVPASYHAGVLDQRYLRTVLAAATFGYPGRDEGRLSAFDGDRGRGLNITGRQRRGFGVELSGVLFDPSASLVDIDEPPNSDPLLCLPIVSACDDGTASPDTLNDLGLLPEQGGTSGGWYDLDAEHPGAHQVVSKTPGHEFPGLHAGYLIGGRPDEMLNRRIGNQADDIETVIISRPATPGVPVSDGARISEEHVSTGFGRQEHRVNGFARLRDHSDPIATQFRSTRQFLLTTDPPGLDAFKYKAALRVRERPLDQDRDQAQLLVSTMSTGNEALVKGLADFAIDVGVNVTAAAVLGAVTGGTGAACGGLNAAGVAGDVATAGVTLALDVMESEVLDGQLPSSNANLLRVTHAIAQDGQSIPGFAPSIQVSYSDFGDGRPTVKNLAGQIVERVAGEPEIPASMKRATERWGASVDNVRNLGLCALLTAPFNALKDELKASVTVEGLGGNGSAEAIGQKVLALGIPTDAQLEPGQLYNAHWEVRRTITVIPKEPAPREIADYPSYAADAATEADVDLVARLIRDAEAGGDDSEAAQLLRRLAVNSVWRRTDNEVYDDYKLRWGRLPTLEAVVVPNTALEEGGPRIGDFELTNGETTIPISVGSSALASRSNENASARAEIGIDGVELFLMNPIVLSPE